MESNYKLVEYSWSLFVWQMLILATLILWIYCLVDLYKSNFEGSEKLIWSLLVIFLPMIGSILYLLIGTKKKLTES
jgi:hypothetical protein